MIKQLVGLAVCLLAVAPLGSAQEAPPGTEVFLLSLPDLELIANVSDRSGYDNQPSFSPDGRTLYFTSFRDGQTDIYGYAIGADQGLQQITATPESEYSPTPVPGLAALSVVRVEMDGRQLLWCLAPDGDTPRLLLPDIEPVGYHAWVDPQRLALFVLGESMTLQTAAVGPGSGSVLAADIGRGLQSLPDGRIAFVQLATEPTPMISAVDIERGEVTALIAARADSQDFAVAADGTIWMAEGNRLFTWHPHRNAGRWQQKMAFSAPTLKQISRIALSPDGKLIALVGAEPLTP